MAAGNFQAVQKAYAVVGAAFIPMLAVALLTQRSQRVGDGALQEFIANRDCALGHAAILRRRRWDGNLQDVGDVVGTLVLEKYPREGSNL
jgi:hypothetical protein